MNSLSKIPFHGGHIVAAKDADGKPLVALKPVCEALGIDAASQRKKLKRSAWAAEVMMTSTGSDGKNYQMVMLDRQSFTMWLATIEVSRLKNEAAKELLTAYQREAAEALDRYFHEGGAINPRATEHQTKALFYGHMQRLEVLQAAKGLVHPDYLEAKARIVLSESDGTIPELDPQRKPLSAHEYLTEKGLKAARIKSISPNFGKKLKKLYMETHGVEPMKTTKDIRGHFTSVYAYTEQDRPLMDQIYAAHYNAAPMLEVVA